MEHVRLEPENLSRYANAPFALDVQVDGELVCNAEVSVGYSHRGIEKIGEYYSYNYFAPYLSRIDFLSSIHCEHVYSMAVEKLGEIRVPQRAEYVRVIVSELNRIASHLYFMGIISRAVGSEAPMNHILIERDKINALFEMLCGARLNYNYIRIGGVAHDISEGFIEKTLEFIEQFKPKLVEIDEMLRRNNLFEKRVASVGIIKSQDAISYAMSGPSLRASGIKWDIRRNEEYSIYDKFDFDIPIGIGSFGSTGDCFDRYVVRIEEIRQSLKIIGTALNEIPTGPFRAEVPREIRLPKGEIYSRVESPRGELGCYIVSTEETIPDRVSFRTPSFFNVSILGELLKGNFLADIPVIVASLDINISEVDR